MHKHIISSLAKWLSVRLRTKWFWVRVQLQSFHDVCVLIFNRSLAWYIWNIRLLFIYGNFGTILEVAILTGALSIEFFHCIVLDFLSLIFPHMYSLSLECIGQCTVNF